MVNKKKQTKITVEPIAKRKMICIRPTMPQKKLKEKKRKHLQPKKYKVFKKKIRCQGILLKKRCQSSYKSALLCQPQKQHQAHLQHVHQSKF